MPKAKPKIKIKINKSKGKAGRNKNNKAKPKVSGKKGKNKSQKVALVDVEIMLHQVLADCTEEDVVDGECVPRVDVEAAADELMTRVQQVTVEAGCASSVLAVGSKENFRKRVMPEYKEHRGPKPFGYFALLAAMKERHDDVRTEPRLEADDVIGLLATNPGVIRKGLRRKDVVVVSTDKDFRSVVCTLYNPMKTGVEEIDERKAAHNHMTQTLTGDTADGYKGCIGVGPVRASALLAPSVKGMADAWDCVVESFENAGMSADDALENARVARILQFDDYDFDTGEISLWEPTIGDGKKAMRDFGLDDG